MAREEDGVLKHMQTPRPQLSPKLVNHTLEMKCWVLGEDLTVVFHGTAGWPASFSESATQANVRFFCFSFGKTQVCLLWGGERSLHPTCWRVFIWNSVYAYLCFPPKATDLLTPSLAIQFCMLIKDKGTRGHGPAHKCQQRWWDFFSWHCTLTRQSWFNCLLRLKSGDACFYILKYLWA